MTMLAYFLVGADGQEAKPQLGAIEQAHEVGHWFADMASSRSTPALERSGFGELRRLAKKGDVMVVSSLDCLGASVTELIEVFQTLNEKGVAVISTQENLHLSIHQGTADKALLEKL